MCAHKLRDPLRIAVLVNIHARQITGIRNLDAIEKPTQVEHPYVQLSDNTIKLAARYISLSAPHRMDADWSAVHGILQIEKM